MSKVFNFLLTNWDIIAPVVYEIIVRLIPTKKNLSLLDNSWKLVNLIVENKRKADLADSVVERTAKGKELNSVNVRRDKHILSAVAFFLLSSFAVAQSPTNTLSRGLFIYSGGTQDTTFLQNTRNSLQSSQGNTGLLYFDKARNKWRVWDGAAYTDLLGASGGGIPGGANTEVQFNDGGIFGGDSEFTYDKTGKVLTVPAVTGLVDLSLESLTDDILITSGDDFFINATDIVNTIAGGNISFLSSSGAVNFSSNSNGINFNTAGVNRLAISNGGAITIGILPNDDTETNLVTWNSTTDQLEYRTVSSLPTGGSPGGSDKQLQYNNAGAFGGLPIEYDNSTGSLTGTVTGSVNISGIASLDLGSAGLIQLSNGSDMLLNAGGDFQASAGSGIINMVATTSTFSGKGIFTTNGTLAGLNIGSFAGYPSTLTNFDIWGNSANNTLNARLSGNTTTIMHLIGTASVANRIPYYTNSAGGTGSENDFTYNPGNNTLFVHNIERAGLLQLRTTAGSGGGISLDSDGSIFMSLLNDLIISKRPVNDTANYLLTQNGQSGLVQRINVNDLPAAAPAGSDTYVQYNDGGVFGGESTFTYNDATNNLTVSIGTFTSNITTPSVQRTGNIAITASGGGSDIFLNAADGLEFDATSDIIFESTAGDFQTDVDNIIMRARLNGTASRIDFDVDTPGVFINNTNNLSAQLTLGAPGSTNTFSRIQLYGEDSGARWLSINTNTTIDVSTEVLAINASGVPLSISSGGGDLYLSAPGDNILIRPGITGYVRISNLPNNCTGYPTGAIWNDGGTLKICP